jgi:hypothetical protein
MCDGGATGSVAALASPPPSPPTFSPPPAFGTAGSALLRPAVAPVREMRTVLEPSHIRSAQPYRRRGPAAARVLDALVARRVFVNTHTCVCKRVCLFDSGQARRLRWVSTMGRRWVGLSDVTEVALNRYGGAQRVRSRLKCDELSKSSRGGFGAVRLSPTSPL